MNYFKIHGFIIISNFQTYKHFCRMRLFLDAETSLRKRRMIVNQKYLHIIYFKNLTVYHD